jgi:DNA-binding transcriptional ArsR family regulator
VGVFGVTVEFDREHTTRLRLNDKKRPVFAGVGPLASISRGERPTVSWDGSAYVLTRRPQLSGLMARDPEAEESEPAADTVLEALEDPDCREIIRVLSEPMTAEEISAATDIPKSTAYRKLELLTDASLLVEGVEIRSDGQHASRYGVAFDEVTVRLDENREFEVELSREPQSAEERLAALWSEVQKET